MAASSGLLLPSKSHFHGVRTPFSYPSSVRFRGVNIISRRISLIQICRCQFGSESDNAFEQFNTFTAADNNRYAKRKKTIIVVGLSVHSTPVELREKLAIPEARWPQAIEELCELTHIEEAAVLSTCNRTEIYVLALSQYCGVKEVTQWISEKSGVSVAEIREHRVLLYNKDAIKHLFQVSSGLDSLVLGECQILAQVKQVVKVGQDTVGFGKLISMLFKSAVSVGKRVRTETKIAAGAVSVSSAAVELAMMKLAESSSDSGTRMLVVGAGKMGKLVIKHLVDKGCKRVVVVNRSEESVVAISREMKGVEIVYKPLCEMYDCAAKADVVFTCTASESPLFLKQHLENLRGLRLFIDISVPRNVGSCVDELVTARVYNVDDLKQVVEANKEGRLSEAMEARSIIRDETMLFQGGWDSLGAVSTIKKLREF